jgi:hypothetical protein
MCHLRELMAATVEGALPERVARLAAPGGEGLAVDDRDGEADVLDRTELGGGARVDRW